MSHLEHQQSSSISDHEKDPKELEGGADGHVVHGNLDEAVGAPYDLDASKRLVWRQDKRIIPLAVLSYLLAYLDRSNVGNAKVANVKSHQDMLTSLHMTAYQYNVGLMLFYVAYIIFETPGNVMLKKIRPSRWLAIISIIWGITTICLGAVQNFSAFAGVRFLLGATEASLFPGLVTLTTFWYRPEERAVRIALILASATLAGAFGGSLAVAIQQMNGTRGIFAWRWIFILEGIPSVLNGVLLFFCLPDWPEEAKWLSPEEKALAAARLAGDNSSKGHERLSWKEAKEVILDWKMYFHYLAYLGPGPPFASLGLFTPTIVLGLGYSKGAEPNLFSVPPYVIAWVWTVTISLLGDRFNRRGVAAAGSAFIGGIGFLAAGVLEGHHFKTRYGLLIMSLAGAFGCIPPLLGWISSNTRGTTRTLLAIPFMVSISGFGQCLGVWIYKAPESPRYQTGHLTNFGFMMLTTLSSVFLLWYYGRCNKRIHASGSTERLWAM